jgi:hypothetical protein
MDKEAKSELNQILAEHRARLVDSQDREAKLKTARVEFVDAFRALKIEKIGPVLAEFVEKLNEAGHPSSVVEQQEESDRNGHFTPASMSLRISPTRTADPAGSTAGGTKVEVSFSANQHTMKVLVSSTSNANGTFGKRGDYELAELTTGFIESHVLKTIRAAFTPSK